MSTPQQPNNPPDDPTEGLPDAAGEAEAKGRPTSDREKTETAGNG